MGCLKLSYCEVSDRQIFLTEEERTVSEKNDVYNFLTLDKKSDGLKNCDNYYPFGLTFNSYQRESSVDQKFKFQGQEHIDDLDLGWDSFKWRNHQPELGRFFNVDPLASDYENNSPYAFSENHVTAHVELEGLERWSINRGDQLIEGQDMVAILQL